MPAPSTARRRPHISWTVAAVAVTASLGLGLLVGVRPVAAGTAETMESAILSWVNAARVGRGLAPLASRGDMTSLAGDRATRLAATGVLSHDTAGCLPCELDARGIGWHLYGETIAGTGYPWGMEAAQSLYGALAGSPPHWDVLMGPAFDSVGVGIAYRDANQNTYLAIVLIDGDGLSPTPNPTPAPAPRKTAPPPAPTSATVSRVEPVVIGGAISMLDLSHGRTSLASLSWGDSPRFVSRVWRGTIVV